MMRIVPKEKFCSFPMLSSPGKVTGLVRHLHPGHLIIEATSFVKSCFALSHSAVALELVSLGITR